MQVHGIVLVIEAVVLSTMSHTIKKVAGSKHLPYTSQNLTTAPDDVCLAFVWKYFANYHGGVEVNGQHYHKQACLDEAAKFE